MSNYTKTIESVEIEHLIEGDPDLSYLEQDYMDCPPKERNKYKKQDAERLASYGSQWSCIGIRAKATVKIMVSAGHWRVQAFTSGGLWGIETDSGHDYLESVAQEEIEDLKRYLEALGFDISQFNWEEIELVP